MNHCKTINKKTTQTFLNLKDTGILKLFNDQKSLCALIQSLRPNEVNLEKYLDISL